MFADSLFTALGGVTGVILLAIAVYIYVALIRQVGARASTLGSGLESKQDEVSHLRGPAVTHAAGSGVVALSKTGGENFVEPIPAGFARPEVAAVRRGERELGLPEAILALVLISLLVYGTIISLRAPPVRLDPDSIRANLLITVAIVFFTGAFLAIRGYNIASLGGFNRVSFLRAVTTGIVLILAAYPLMVLADVVSQSVLGEPSKQSIVEFFTASTSIKDRIMIIAFAVVVAPVIEEFLFRVFLYRVFRRYFGLVLGMISNAFLFALVHAHLPSFAPLFVLGLCLTIAFEWSGSILVSMTMHSLFNASQLTALAFPELLQQ